MCVKQSLEKKLVKFGKNNSPTFVAMSIAAAKGVFRPAFTMMDTKENYQTKRYTAYREGLTELIAIPVYYLSGVISRGLASKLAVPKNYMSKRVYEQYKSGNTSAEIQDAVKHAENLAKINLPKVKTTAAFIGVCTSALLIIPMLCSATIKPIMSALEKKDAKKNDTVPALVPQKQMGKLNTFKGVYMNNNYGMKVGGV